jgi:2-C-methyl-D-erythritol 4-phosphate cytidylyltransferase
MGQSRFFAVVPAAGVGQRLGGGERKAGARLRGLPLVVWALRAVARARDFGGGVVVAHPGDVERARAEWLPLCPLPRAGCWQVVTGGSTRQESVARGMAAAEAEWGLILVHDAARPLIAPSDIDRVVARARQCGAAILGSPMSDTIKEVDGDRIIRTVARDRLWRAETPQVFWRDWYVSARARGGGTTGVEFTDEAALLEANSAPVQIVPAEHLNLKVTTPSDLLLAEWWLERCAGFENPA